MIHIFFFTLFIWLYTEVQKVNLRPLGLELNVCSISDLSAPEKSGLCLIWLSATHPKHTRQSHCSFWPDIQGKLKSYF